MIGLPNQGDTTLVIATTPERWNDIDLLTANKLVIEGKDRVVSNIISVAECVPEQPGFESEIGIVGLETGKTLAAGRAYDVDVRLLAPHSSNDNPFVHCTPLVNIQIQGLGTIFESYRYNVIYVNDQN